MGFTSLEINNFRGLKSLNIEDFKKVNVISGFNNSGKSSILEALFLLTGITDPFLNIRINNFRYYAVLNGDDLKLIFYNFDTSIPVYLRAKTSDLNTYRELTISSIYNKKDNAISINDIAESKSLVDSLSNISTSSIKGLNLDFSIKERHNQVFKNKTKLILENDKFIPERKFEYSDSLKTIMVNPRYAFATVVESLDKIINDKQKNQIIEVLREIEPRIVDISISANRVIKIDIGLKSLIPINVMGDGIRKLLTILTSIYEVKDGVILIDEIENGMHFSTMKTLWKTIIHASMQFKVQVFVTTHNIEILKSLKEVVKEDMPEFADNLRHYTIQRMQNGVLKPYIYDFDKFDYALSQDLEIRS